MPQVTDAQVASYEAACEALAKRFVGRNNAELDDLVQEGRILVWLSLARGIKPSTQMIENRMEDYVRWLGMLDGKRRYAPENCEGEDCDELNAPVPYEAMLPLDDFRTSAMLDARDSASWLDVETRLG